jgi:hypothetical protein
MSIDTFHKVLSYRGVGITHNTLYVQNSQASTQQKYTITILYFNLTHSSILSNALGEHFEYKIQISNKYIFLNL